MRLAALVLALLPAAPPQGDSCVTTTFGNGDRCEHRGTLKAEGDIVRFDLSALPPAARVFRAVLRVPARGRWAGETIRAIPVGLPDAAPPRLRPPQFGSFDLTEAARAWIARPEGNLGLKIEQKGGVDFRAAVLEVSHAGAAPRPIAPVRGLKAVHRSGQTFVTWTEIEDVVGGDDPAFEDFEKAVLEARRRREVVYRIYRHDRPVTVETLGQAEVAREVPEALSCWNLKAIRNTEHPQKETKNSSLRSGYNLVRADVVRRYRIAEGGDPLPRGTGLAVFTATAPGRRYYAVTASIDGREAVSELGEGASLRQPVEESPSPFPAIVYQRTQDAGPKEWESPSVDVFNSWIEPPLHNVPEVSETFVVRWKDLPKGDARDRLPLFINHGTYGGTATEAASPGWHAARRYVKGAFTIGLSEGGLWQGFHEGVGTLLGYDQGVVHNYPQRRVLAAAAWAAAKEDFFVDPERVALWGQLASWGLRHGDVFAAVMSNGYGNLSIGKLAQQHGWKWGPYPKACRNWLGVDQWSYMNLARWIRENPTVELPYWLCAPAYGAYPAHTIGDFGFMPWPEMIHAMVSTKRAFAANWSTNGPGPTAPLHELVPRLRLRQSLPAFTHCSLDHSPGDGDHADAEKGGGINLHQRWEPETIADEPDRWEITLWLAKESPAPEATTDVTPRRCQRFKAGAGDRFLWTHYAPAEGMAAQSGEAAADGAGLVTVPALRLTAIRSRLKIVRKA